MLVAFDSCSLTLCFCFSLDFNIAGRVTNLVGIHAVDDLSDPYVLFAVGEAGVDWKLRQHQGPLVQSSTINDDLNPIWNETLTIRAAEDLLHPELHVMLYDSDAQLGGVINFEDDFLGEVRIPLLDDFGEVTSTLDMLHEYPLTGELAEAEHSTVTLAWEYVDTVVAPGKNPNFVEYRVTAITLNDR